mmetsp:Transcript_21159/g.66351  ORF Transcript_21159/g.66351 Transcript_21159/m.66351 type:complete len:583 (+) Transcript_21159:129-1877(+)
MPDMLQQADQGGRPEALAEHCAAEGRPQLGMTAAASNAEERCAVCYGLLCEPVAWPGCSHCYCLICSMRTRDRPKPTCPLCREPASRVRRASDLQVDSGRAAQVRRVVGYSRYETQRRELWVEAAALDAQGSLGELPLFSMGPWHFRAGARHRLKLFEPRYVEMLRRVTAPGGRRCFAAVLQPAEFQVGAKGRVCEILESGEESNGDVYVIVEGGAACKILEVSKEQVEQGGAPLFHGSLDELAEEEMESLADTFVPLAAASEMVDLLSTLGRQLRTMRRRRQLLAALGQAEALVDGHEHAAAPPSPPPPPTDEEDMGAMLTLLVSYRSIISQMDRLLTEASQTAERLGLGAPGAPGTQPAGAVGPTADAHEVHRTPLVAEPPTEAPAVRMPARLAEERRRRATMDTGESSVLAPSSPVRAVRNRSMPEGGLGTSSSPASSSTSPPASRASQRPTRMASVGNAALLPGASHHHDPATAMLPSESRRQRAVGTRRRAPSTPDAAALSPTAGPESPQSLGRRSPTGASSTGRRRSGALLRSPQGQPTTPERSRRTPSTLRQNSILLRAATATLPPTRHRGPSSP